MYGNGCAGSTASGVSTGWMRSVKTVPSCRRSSFARSRPAHHGQIRVGQPGQQLVGDQRVCAATSVVRDRRDPVQPLARRGTGGPGVVTPAATRPRRAATRTMKNSSRLREKIATNRTRSSSGTSGSAASSRTRALKCSQLAVRSRNRSAGSRVVSGAGAAAVSSISSALSSAYRGGSGSTPSGHVAAAVLTGPWCPPGPAPTRTKVNDG